MKARLVYLGAGCLALGLVLWLACGERIAGEKDEPAAGLPERGSVVRVDLHGIAAGSHPVAMAAQAIAQAMGNPRLRTEITQLIRAGRGDRKVVDLTTLCARLLDQSRFGVGIAVDTALLRGAVGASAPMELYPYWRQREQWNKAVAPPTHLAVVWCDPTMPEGETVEGWLVPSGEEVMIRDGQAGDLAVLVAAYPEFGGAGKGDGRRDGVQEIASANVPPYERQWQLKWIHIHDDHEPDWLEPPEFYLKANYGSGWEETSITPPVNNTSPWTLTGVYILDLG
ncbi:MAG: hypothetical protein ONB15_04210, partial [candidate division KSB1 bacterium]|nr:hypothetical protein [candidate division KSB1 bacterium]